MASSEQLPITRAGDRPGAPAAAARRRRGTTPRRGRFGCAAALAILLVVGGCRDGVGPPQRVPTSIQLSQEFPFIDEGTTLQLTAALLDEQGTPLTVPPGGHAFRWSSSNERIASVNSTGLVTGNNKGTARITVTAGAIRAEAVLNVRPIPVRIHLISGDGQSGPVGEVLPEPIRIRVTDRHGDGLGGEFRFFFEVLSNASDGWAPFSSLDQDGYGEVPWRMGTSAGPHTLEFRIRDRDVPPVTVHATALPLGAETVERVAGDDQRGAAEAPLGEPLVVRVEDRHGNPVPGVPVSWHVSLGGGSVVAPQATDSAGTLRATWKLGPSRGYQAVEVRAGTAPVARAEFRATAISGRGPYVSGIPQSILRPGMSVTLDGEGFAPQPASNIVTIDGVRIPVSLATPTQLRVVLPSRSSFRCEPMRDVPVTVTVGDDAPTTRLHPLAVGMMPLLRAGESVVLTDPEDVGCLELPKGSAQYGIAVFNASRSANTVTPVRARIDFGADLPFHSLSRGSTAPVRSDLRHQELAPPRSLHAHRRILEANRGVLQRLGAPRRVQREGLLASRSPARVPSVGDRIALRVPDFATTNPCQNFREVTARAVYAGSRAVVLEDTAAPLAGRTDAALQELGREFDGTMFDILEANFGNPLAFDAQLDGNGRILMLFTPEANAIDVAGFVSSTDFYPTRACPSSNVGEIFYAAVPTDSSSGYGPNTVAEWRWSVRSTVIHEAKHITSLAERLARAGSGPVVWEESWLEEATAMVAEELWARAVYGYSYRGGTGYEASVECELRCPGKPLAMLRHFDGLYRYYSRIEQLSPLGPVDSGDWTFYASGWWFLRWAADHHPAGEAALLRGLTQQTQRSGIASLEAQTGRSFTELLGDWSLAVINGSGSGHSPSQPELRVESWNEWDVFRSLHRDFRQVFPRSSPLNRQQFPESRVLDLTVRGGSAAYFDFWADEMQSHLLHLNGTSGARLPPAMGVSIIRLH